MGSILLVAAVFASLAFGVLVAYVACVGLFTVLRMQMGTADQRSEAVPVVAAVVKI